MVRLRCQQIKAKYRAKFQDHVHDDDDDDNPDSDFEEQYEEGEEALFDEGDEEHGGRQSDDPLLRNAPDGMEAYQKASAWYYVSYSDATNPYIAEARSAGVGLNQPHMLYLSFPWICAYQQLCQIKEMSLKHGPPQLP